MEPSIACLILAAHFSVPIRNAAIYCELRARKPEPIYCIGYEPFDYDDFLIKVSKVRCVKITDNGHTCIP